MVALWIIFFKTRDHARDGQPRQRRINPPEVDKTRGRDSP
jgi:hypothetical protein